MTLSSAMASKIVFSFKTTPAYGALALSHVLLAARKTAAGIDAQSADLQLAFSATQDTDVVLNYNRKVVWVRRYGLLYNYNFRKALFNGVDITGSNAVCRSLAAIYPASGLYGLTADVSSQIDHWLDFAQDNLYVSDFKKLSSSFDVLDNHLTVRSFIVGYSATIADYAIWGALKSNAIFNKQVKGGKYNGQHLIKWFNSVSGLEPVSASLKALSAAKDAGKDRKDQGSMDIGLPDAMEGKVVTRFPPEPSGYLHIGHAKAVLLNDYFARQYKGKLIIRFDDTNPSKEKSEFEESITEDIALLGVKGDILTHTSDHFEHLYGEAIKLINLGLAYVDNTDQDTMRAERFDGIDSKNRNLSVEDNLRLFEDMKNGTESGLKSCLRAKIDMQDKNKAMRDPVIYRCNLVPHHRTGTSYKIYPTYDFACPIVDSREGVTHALRTIEYRDRNAQYTWFLKALDLRWVHVWDFSRLNFVYTLLSKRKLTWFVEQGLVTGWDDPRFPTVRGIRRRGLTIEALRQYIISQGASQRDLMLEWDKLWAMNKKVIDPVSPRHVGISKQNIVKATFVDSDIAIHAKELLKHKKNPDLGMKTTIFSPEIFLEQEDAKEFEQDEELTLMDWGNAIVKSIKRNSETNLIDSVELQLNLAGDVKKTKKKLTWLSSPLGLADNQKPVSITLFDYDYLITKKKLEEEDSVEDHVTKVTEFKVDAFGDANLCLAQRGDIIQLERRGYYICDQAYDATNPESVVHLIYIPDGKLASLASKAVESGSAPQASKAAATASTMANKKNSSKKQPAAATAHSSRPDAMYQVGSVYGEQTELDIDSTGKMYAVERVYGPDEIETVQPKVITPPVAAAPVSAPETSGRPKKTKTAAPAPAASSEVSLISKLDIVVGKIVDVKKHPDADTLYVEQIDVGEDKPREVVSGLVKFMTEDEILGKTILVLKNLKPVAPMQWCYVHPNATHDKVEFLVPPAGSVPGDRVYFEGHEGEPEAQLNPKKKVWEALQPDFSTRDDLVAVWKDLEFRTAKGVVTTSSLAKASIK
ncbi:glutamate-tRNA ligase [Batrachochytrium salamandrivorans]|nr:glutamate-tRNA ligase [Batrachochytrium salamandrivorans]